MHWARRPAGARRRDSIPAAVRMIISPGSTSRMKFAPTRSKAQVSEASRYIPSRYPRESGRKPSGSRQPMSVCSSMIRQVTAPSTRPSASATRSGSAGCCERAIRWSTTSESVVVWKIDPSSSMRRRRATTFVRLPLCAIASFPPFQSTRIGWTFRSLVAFPVVA